jgi:transcriptional regulator
MPKRRLDADEIVRLRAQGFTLQQIATYMLTTPGAISQVLERIEIRKARGGK